MARSRRAIPLLVNGSLDTKSNPKLVQPGSLLELENMYQIQTGRMIPRNGYTQLIPSAAFDVDTGDNLFATLAGGLGTISRNWKSATAPFPVALKLGNLTDPSQPGWATNGTFNTVAAAYPWVTARVSGARVMSGSSTTAAIDVSDPDIAATNLNLRAAYWTDANLLTTSQYWDAHELGTLRSQFNAFNPTGIAPVAGYLPKIAPTGTGSHVAFFAKTGANQLSAASKNASGTSVSSAAIVADLAANGFFDVKPIPGAATIAVAWAVNGGGIKCAIYDPATGALSATVATAGADPSLCMGWLDDQLSTGSMLLATCGTAAGLIVRVMSAATMVVSATNTIDAAATANVRNVTGHTVTGVAGYTVAWDIAGSSALYDKIRIGLWTGAAVVRDFYGNHSLYSRSIKLSDGRYYMLGCLTSTVQGQYTLISFDGVPSGTLAASRGIPACSVLAGEGGTRRRPCTLASAVSYSGTMIIPVTRNKKVTAPDGSTASPQKTIAYLTFGVTTKVTRARELGGTMFIPGGVMHRDDTATIEPATFPIYPEVLSGTSSNAGGSMTAGGAYSYRQVFRGIDAAGRITWSAASVPFAITLGAGDNRVTLACFNLKAPRGDFNTSTSGYGTIISEIYRRGPAATGATLYNKVGEVLVDISAGGDTTAFVDTMSDANAALGQVGYFTGNVLENFNPPSHSLLEVNAGRVGIVNAEDQTEFWFSKEYKPGTGVGFNPLLKLQIAGDGAGGMTALAAMDGRWILFKKTAIYVISGDGPNDLGQGSFNAPQAVSRTIGTTNPSSVLETPDGIMFQASAGGMWLLDRGLNLTYVGAPIEAEVIAATVTGAALVSNLPIARFVTQTGRLLEWDYFHKRWYRHQLRTGGRTVVDCANSALHGWCYLLDDGTLMQESVGAVLDTMGTTTPIIPIVSFPHLQLAGLAGYQRLHAIEFTLDVLGDHTVSLDAEYDFAGSVTGTPKTLALVAASTPTIQIEYNPLEGMAKCTSIRPLITVSGTPAGSTFAITGATAYVSVKRGTAVHAADRAT